MGYSNEFEIIQLELGISYSPKHSQDGENTKPIPWHPLSLDIVPPKWYVWPSDLHAFFGLPGFFAAGLPGNIIYLQLQGWMQLKKYLMVFTDFDLPCRLCCDAVQTCPNNVGVQKLESWDILIFFVHMKPWHRPLAPCPPAFLKALGFFLMTVR